MTLLIAATSTSHVVVVCLKNIGRNIMLPINNQGTYIAVGVLLCNTRSFTPAPLYIYPVSRATLCLQILWVVARFKAGLRGF